MPTLWNKTLTQLTNLPVTYFQEKFRILIQGATCYGSFVDLANPWSHLTRHGTVWTGHHPLRVTYPPRCQVWGKRITCTRIRGTAHAPGTASTCRFTLLSNLHTREATARGGKSRCFFTCESRLSWKDRKHTTV